MFFCSLPCTKTSAGNTPELELCGLVWVIVLRLMGREGKYRLRRAIGRDELKSKSQATDYSDAALSRKTPGWHIAPFRLFKTGCGIFLQIRMIRAILLRTWLSNTKESNG